MFQIQSFSHTHQMIELQIVKTLLLSNSLVQKAFLLHYRSLLMIHLLIYQTYLFKDLLYLLLEDYCYLLLIQRNLPHFSQAPIFHDGKSSLEILQLQEVLPKILVYPLVHELVNYQQKQKRIIFYCHLTALVFQTIYF